MALSMRIASMDREQLRAFTDFVDWFFNVYESTAFEKGGAHLPCPRWWEHPEAVERLYTLHCLDAVIEEKDGAGLDNFWRSVDHHAEYLFGARSPFRDCNAAAHGQSLALSVHVGGVQLGSAMFDVLTESDAVFQDYE